MPRSRGEIHQMFCRGGEAGCETRGHLGRHAALARTCAHEPAAGWPHWAQRHRTRLRRGGDWGALQALVRRCGAGCGGRGMNQWQVPLRAVQETDLDVVMLAGRWTLADRSGAPLLEACADRNVSVLAAGPFNSGLLARADRKRL